jgi:arylsulfatase A-like enzyme
VAFVVRDGYEGCVPAFSAAARAPRRAFLRFLLLLTLTAVLPAVPGCKQRRPLPPPGSPSLVLISLDTLRADHLGCYGYERPTSPNLDRFAAGATLFETAMSTAPKTGPSHMSMFTSLYPAVHGIGMLANADARDIEVGPLHPDIRTLAEILHSRGYATAGYHGGGFMRAQFGFDRGFERYREGVVEDAIAWLDEHAQERPFFLLFHTYEVHDPYTPEPPYDTLFSAGYDGRIIHDRRRLKTLAGSKDWANYSKLFWDRVDRDDPRDVAQLIALYDGEIAALDARLAGLLEAIEKRAPDSVVVILSDHGEQFGEHDDFVHSHVYQELVHVPLIVRRPGQAAGKRVRRPVSLIDLAPTLLELLGAEPIEQFQGRSLAPLIVSGSGAGAEPAGASTRSELFSSNDGQRQYTVRDEDWRLISTPHGFELYDEVADPEEQTDLLSDPARTSPRASAAYRRLSESLEHWQQANAVVAGRYRAAAKGEPLDDETIEQLRALGYLN